jgi:hypothetical protein
MILRNLYAEGRTFSSMRALPTPPGCGLKRRTLQVLLFSVTVLGLAFGCQGDGNYFTHLHDSRRLAADLRVQFNQAADASNRAVMADTDEASVSFVRDAESSAKNVEKDVATLTPLLHRLSVPNPIRSLEEFSAHFAEYREVDRSVLALAVDNTNLQAQRLAFGPAREAADAFRDALGVIASSSPPSDRCSIEALVAKATIAVREIQALLAPHIAESRDATMTDMERNLANLDASARSAVKSLQESVSPSARPALAGAVSALDRFDAISGQIVALSRRNTHVRALELSLRTKPALAAACDNSLRALQEMLAKEGIKATR